MTDKTISLAKNKTAMALLEKFAKQGWPDQKIKAMLAQEFGYEWDIQTVRRNRKKIGNFKTSLEDRPILSIPPPGLLEHEKANWFREQFKRSHLYKELKDQFHKYEIHIYLEEYGSVCCQFEDIVTSEFFQIDDYLKHRILISRQLKIMKRLELEIDEVAQWIAKNPFNKDELDLDPDLRSELNKARIDKHRQLDGLHHAMKSTNDRYDKLVAERQRIMNNLAATRKDRQEELRGGKETFFQLVSTLQASNQERERQGKYAQLTKLASEEITTTFRKPVEFPDGHKEPIILDEHTVFEEEIDE